ncbi:hypothetical protein GS636_21695 [Ruegeria sp. HKCCD4884]|uniref:hypothetical protein n=1 Tax=Ruegeria sp. HKCCD4884 TaxID=2683022 RepID=UPI0014921059|nr:hypothetical protein [Ruegeria sp. HKCCD4884]NOD95421.1 hypothetical protein [Ruegeria sp. HKCCD4884]
MSADTSAIGKVTMDDDEPWSYKDKHGRRPSGSDTKHAKRVRMIAEIQADAGRELDPEELEDEIELRLEKEKKAARQQVFSTKVNLRLYRKWDKVAKKKGKSVVVAMEESMLAFLEKHDVDFEF